MDIKKQAQTRELCFLAVKAAINTLIEVGTWPRPPAAKELRPGFDFYYKDIEDTPEVQEFIQYLATDQDIQSIYIDDPSNPPLWVFYQYWQRLLLEVLSETEGVIPNRRIFGKWFGRFLKELYSDSIKQVIVNTVSGLKLEVPRLKLDKETTLTSFSATYWWQKILRDYNYDVLSKWDSFHRDEASIVTTKSISKLTYRGRTHPSIKMSDIIRHSTIIEAIRLTCAGVPRMHCTVDFQLGSFPLNDPFAYTYREGEQDIYENTAILQPKDLKRIKRVWSDWVDSEAQKGVPIQMNTAYNRFISSYDPKNLLECVLDLTIALESLFSPVENQELSHRIALRVAWLLGLEYKEADASISGNRIYKVVRKMYDIRSKMVHGGPIKQKEVSKWIEVLSGKKADSASEGDLSEQAKEGARSIVRKAINACSTLFYKKGSGPEWPFPDDFDVNIVTPRQRQLWQKLAGIRK